jgi:hypothetical protein
MERNRPDNTASVKREHVGAGLGCFDLAGRWFCSPQKGKHSYAPSSPDAGSEVLRRAGSIVEESGSSGYLRTGVISKRSSHATDKETSNALPN